MNDFFSGLIRTYVPVAVAAIVTWLASIGVIVPDESSTALATFLGGLAGAAYYTIVRVLERKFPRVGALLGVAKAPVYVDPAAITPENSDNVVAEVTQKVNNLYTTKNLV